MPTIRWLLVLVLALACQRTPVARIDPLPGAEPFSPALSQTLGAALGAKGAGYVPRTRHLRDDGSPRFTNRLLLDPSPYLQQHAHNPVDWYPWGPEAFAKARAEARPILLSVGYSTCHWCHVMEEESFEDEEIATFLNQRYVAIKVDREVRPDIDDAYMGAVQLVSGRGGWPMTVWLTPQGEPFYADTYVPAHDGERGVRVGFATLLRRLREVFDTQPERVATQGATIAARVRELSAPAAADELPGPAALHAAFARFTATFDAEHGGFGRAPKFPTPPALDFLLRYARHAEQRSALDMVTRTLTEMAAGGIHDHVGGGFHRYATDQAWLVPHFEKMLYDNAQLASVYLAAFQATGDEQFAAVTRDILDYVARDMTAPGGAFYAATDADSEGEEGRFFLWTPAEIRAVLDPAHADAVIAYFAVTEPGSFGGRSILHTPRPLAEVAADLKLEPARLQQLVDEARPRLYAARARRVPPNTDTKVLTGWNGLMISAFARAGAVLARPDYVERARTAARFILDEMRPGGRLQRVHAAGRAHEDAFLDDYAFLAAGLIDLYEATFDARWLREAIALHAILERDYWDAEHGGFFLTATTQEAPLARQKPDADGALPSGNAVASLNLLRLAELTTDDRHRARADAVLRALGKDLQATPSGAPALLAALDFRLDRVKEIVIVHPAAARDGAASLLAAVRSAYVPNGVVMLVADGGAGSADLPLTQDKRALNGVATAYVCEQRVCALPTSDPKVLARQLGQVTALPAS